MTTMQASACSCLMMAHPALLWMATTSFRYSVFPGKRRKARPSGCLIWRSQKAVAASMPSTLSCPRSTPAPVFVLSRASALAASLRLRAGIMLFSSSRFRRRRASQMSCSWSTTLKTHRQPLTPLSTITMLACSCKLMVGEQALQEEFYSVTPGGTQFSMGLGFGAGGPGVPVISTSYTESPDRPQLPIRPDGLVELFHWSETELTEVDPAFAGIGPLQGVERQRGARLSFFGINPREAVRSQGTGYVKESGLGPIQHVAFVDPASLYPIFEDPDGIATGKNISDAEAAIREGGPPRRLWLYLVLHALSGA